MENTYPKLVSFNVDLRNKSSTSKIYYTRKDEERDLAKNRSLARELLKKTIIDEERDMVENMTLATKGERLLMKKIIILEKRISYLEERDSERD